MRTISSSAMPVERRCLRRKYLPASTKARFGTSPTISVPVTRTPRASAFAAHLVESRVERRSGDVGDVHRNLRDAVLLDEPADGLRGRERPGLHHGIPRGVLHHAARDRVALADGTPLFAHVEGDGVGAARGGGVQVEVHGDQEVARPDGRGPPCGQPPRRRDASRNRVRIPCAPVSRAGPRTPRHGTRRGFFRSGAKAAAS